jgi:hypothetical protein
MHITLIRSEKGVVHQQQQQAFLSFLPLLFSKNFFTTHMPKKKSKKSTRIAFYCLLISSKIPIWFIRLEASQQTKNNNSRAEEWNFYLFFSYIKRWFHYLLNIVSYFSVEKYLFIKNEWMMVILQLSICVWNARGHIFVNFPYQRLLTTCVNDTLHVL